ncbi:MAG: hypothetical protein Ct9H300mP21_08180 [Pseudomonadota bacterium]|nr:MAG: hypothetical protein Ct9H300mP21_08180 [Pseudomonadota bacterium]
MNTNTKPDTAASEVPENLNSGKKSRHIKQADFFRNLLLGISIILVVGTAIFQLDLTPSVMLGCAVIGFNYYWTVKFVQKLLLEAKIVRTGFAVFTYKIRDFSNSFVWSFDLLETTTYGVTDRTFQCCTCCNHVLFC